jgi:hypothetical protein
MVAAVHARALEGQGVNTRANHEPRAGPPRTQTGRFGGSLSFPGHPSAGPADKVTSVGSSLPTPSTAPAALIGAGAVLVLAADSAMLPRGGFGRPRNAKGAKMDRRWQRTDNGSAG